MRAFALKLGLNPTDIGEQFRDYWLSAAGAKARKADWGATWRGWCRREAERKASAAFPAKSPPKGRHPLEEQAERMMARMGQDSFEGIDQ